METVAGAVVLALRHPVTAGMLGGIQRFVDGPDECLVAVKALAFVHVSS
ncbi:hypothetical protein JK635_06990, partial [Neobacillus sp. YIM B02564]|nr:hypothetical protein [Neobacillus paridis]